jgi:hypothetical protein
MRGKYGEKSKHAGGELKISTKDKFTMTDTLFTDDLSLEFLRKKHDYTI